MKRVLLLVALIAAVLTVPSVSQGASQAFYWTPGTAARALVNSGIQWQDGYDSIDYARCQGYGYYLRRGGALYFNTFQCYTEPSNDAPYWVRLTVAGRSSFTVRFLCYHGDC